MKIVAERKNQRPGVSYRVSFEFNINFSSNKERNFSNKMRSLPGFHLLDKLKIANLNRRKPHNKQDIFYSYPGFIAIFKMSFIVT